MNVVLHKTISQVLLLVSVVHACDVHSAQDLQNERNCLCNEVRKKCEDTLQFYHRSATAPAISFYAEDCADAVQFCDGATDLASPNARDELRQIITKARTTLGVGFNNEFSNSTSSRQIPALSAKYGLSKDFHVNGIFGFNTLSPAGFTLGAKIFKNIFYETYLNFYGAVGLAYLKNERSGIEMIGVLGAEFFIPGVDSLGFLFEFGASASNVTGTFGLKTLGATFLTAGMHFYF
jgi:hypothetical protein